MKLKYSNNDLLTWENCILGKQYRLVEWTNVSNEIYRNSHPNLYNSWVGRVQEYRGTTERDQPVFGNGLIFRGYELLWEEVV